MLITKTYKKDIKNGRVTYTIDEVGNTATISFEMVGKEKCSLYALDSLAIQDIKNLLTDIIDSLPNTIVVLAPIIDLVSDTTVAIGDTIIIQGENFTVDTTVKIGEISQTVTFINSTLLQVKIAALTVTGNLIVTTGAYSYTHATQITII